MKIGIYGSYGGSSIGDEAILRGLLKLISNNMSNIQKVYIFTKNSSKTDKAINFSEFSFEIKLIDTRGITNNKNINLKSSKSYKKEMLIKMWLNFNKYFPTLGSKIDKWQRFIFKKHTLYEEVIKDIDVLLFGGGNILMDLYPAWIDMIDNIYSLAVKYQKKVYFLGIGAGPISTKKGQKLIKKIGNKSYISVRDQESKKLLEELHVKNVKLGSDLAIGNLTEYEPKERFGIGVTVIPYYANFYWPKSNKEYYLNYKKNMASILDRYIEKTNKEIEFFATNFPADINVAKEIKEQMKNKNRVKVLDKELTVEEIIEFIRSKELILGTRLHSLILSYISDTNFFAFNYQPKVNYFLNKLDKVNDFIDISYLSNGLVDENEMETYVNKIIQLKKNDENLKMLINKDNIILKEELSTLFIRGK